MTNQQINNAVNAVVNNFTGQRIAMPNGQYLGECTAPICWYLHYLELPIPPMHNNRADGWGVSNPSELMPFFTFEAFDVNKAYPRGSIIMWDSPHIALVLADTAGDNYVTCFEQNADPDGAPCGTHTRVLNNAYHHATFAMIPKIEPDTPPPPPFTVEEIDPKQVITNKQPTTMWGMNYGDLTAMLAHPIKQVDQGTVLTVVEKLHHNNGYTYYREANNVDAWNTLDCDDYTPPPPKPYEPPAAPVPMKRAPKVDIVTEVPYFATPANARNKYKEAGKLKAGSYYQISVENAMWNLSSDNMKDLQHWVNPSDNVPPPPEPEPTPDPGHDTWKASYQSFNANRKPVKYVMMQTYTVKDLAGTGVPRKIKQYTEVPIYGTFTASDGHLYGRLKLSIDTEWKYWYGLPMIPEVVELEQEIYNPETDVSTRIATKQLTVRDYEILALDKVERVAKTVESLGAKFIDGITRRKKK